MKKIIFILTTTLNVTSNPIPHNHYIQHYIIKTTLTTTIKPPQTQSPQPFQLQKSKQLS